MSLFKLKRVSSFLYQHSRRNVYGIGMPAPPELRDIVKLDLFEEETEQKIEQIWLEQYRFDPRYISRVINKTNHELLIKRLEECPIFIWPINYGKTQKYYVLLSQYQHKHIFFTSIDSYNSDPENASTYLSLTFYDDLISKQKNISLIRGEVIQPIHLTIDIARDLIDDLIKNYQTDTSFTNNIQKFNSNPQGFDLEQYLNRFDFVREANMNHTKKAD